MIKFVAACVASIIATLFVPSPAIAGTCQMAGPACSEYWKADLVFVGIVTEMYQPDIPAGQTWGPASIARFKVEDPFRGVNTNTVEIAAHIRRAGNVAFSSDGLYFNFVPGKRYLVYAHRSSSNKWIWASICSRTAELADAADDLKYIRGLSRAAPGGSILGIVRRTGEWLEDDSSGPVGGLRVTAVGPAGRVETLTNRRGEYRFDRLKLGKYKLSFLIPENFVQAGAHDEKTRSVSVMQDRGCVESHLMISADGLISGRVVDEDGRPVPAVRVEILSTEAPKDDDDQFRQWTTSTDAKGRYTHRPIPPGNYWLGINITGSNRDGGYDPTYYPGVTEREGAWIFAIGEGQQLTGYDLRVPSVTARRTISGVVQSGEGRPLPAAIVALQSSIDAGPRWDLAVTSDGQGRFSITEHDSYVVSVHVKCLGKNGGATLSDPVRIEKRIGEITPFIIYATAASAVCAPAP